jgi:hypothetical protein
MDYLEQCFTADEGQSVGPLKQIETCLLRHCREPIKVTVDDVPQLIITVVNLAYGSPISREDLLSADKARAALATQVVDKFISGKFIWAALASHMGTHHPKSRNDKVSSGPVVARSLALPPAGLVTSASLKTRQFSGSGNGANTAHYQWLAFTYEDSAGVLSVIERAANQDEPLRAALMALGIDSEQWEAFQIEVSAHLSAPNVAALDRQLKQIFVPDPTQGGEDYVVITPLTATRVVSAFEQQRAKLWEQNITLNFDRISIGGAKPHNAGSLMSELGGNLRLLTMTIPPRLSSTQQQRRLWLFLQKGKLFQPMPEKEARQLRHWLEQDWKHQYGNRQDYLRRLEQRLAEWLLLELEEQDQFLDWLISARQQLDVTSLPNWILTLAGISKTPETWHRVHQARQRAAHDALIFNLRSPLGDEVDKLVRDALESLFAKLYSGKKVAA